MGRRGREKRRMGRPGKRRKMGPQERWVRAGLPEVGPGMGFGFLVLGLGWVSFLLLLLFLIQTSLDSNANLNPNHTQLKVCTSMNALQIFKPRQILITYRTKF